MEEAASWWAIALIPIGLVGFIGGTLARTRADLAAIFMLLAGLSALVVGLYSAEDAFEGSGFAAGYLSLHPLMSSSPFFIPPLVLLIVGGALALAAKKAPDTKSAPQEIPFSALISSLIAKVLPGYSSSNEQKKTKSGDEDPPA